MYFLTNKYIRKILLEYKYSLIYLCNILNLNLNYSSLSTFCYSKLSLVYSCCGCGSYNLQPLGVVKQHPEKPNVDKFSLPHAPSISPNCVHCGQKQHVCIEVLIYIKQ